MLRGCGGLGTPGTSRDTASWGCAAGHRAGGTLQCPAPYTRPAVPWIAPPALAPYTHFCRALDYTLHPSCRALDYTSPPLALPSPFSPPRATLLHEPQLDKTNKR